MKRFGILTMAAVMLILASCADKKPQPPVAAKKPFTVESNGNERNDDYFWLRLSDEQKNAESPDSQTVEVVKYLTAEDDYATAMMKHTEALQLKLFEEIKGRIKEDDASVPYLDNGYYYQTKYFIGKEYPVFYRKKEGADSARCCSMSTFLPKDRNIQASADCQSLLTITFSPMLLTTSAAGSTRCSSRT